MHLYYFFAFLLEQTIAQLFALQCVSMMSITPKTLCNKISDISFAYTVNVSSDVHPMWNR